MRGRAQLGALAAADSRKSKSVFKRLTGFIYKMGENNKMIKKKKNPVPKPHPIHPITHSSFHFFWTERHGDWVTLGIPSAWRTRTNFPLPQASHSVLAQPKYYLAQASSWGLPRLPMGPAPVGLHLQEAQHVPTLADPQHHLPYAYAQEPDSLCTTYSPKLPM